MTETRWGSSNRFQGLNGAHAVFARTASLTGRCWPGSFGDRVPSGIQPRQHVDKDGPQCHPNSPVEKALTLALFAEAAKMMDDLIETSNF